MLAEFPAYLPEAVLSGRAGMNLPSVLNGTLEPDEIVSPPKGASAAEYLYEASPTLRVAHHAVREALAAIIEEWPAERRLRILEIGAGAAGVTAELVAMIPADRCDYAFTSPLKHARARAEAEFGHLRAVSIVEIDLAADPQDQQLDPNSYDVVIASHALHTLVDLGAALDVIRWSLVRDGLLLLLERAPERLTDLVFGLRPDWWARSADEAKPHGRLLSEEEWCSVLARRGFLDAVPCSEPAPDLEASSLLIVARNPEHTDVVADASMPEPDTYLLLADRACRRDSVSHYLAEQLRNEGHHVLVASAGEAFRRLDAQAFALAPERAEDFTRLFQILSDEGIAPTHVVHLMGLGLESTGDDAGSPALARERCLSALHLSRAVLSLESPARLWFITSGAPTLEPAGDRPRWSRPAEGGLWGFGRVLMNEHPEVRCRLIDLQLKDGPANAARLIATELRAPDDEEEILLTSDARYGVRLERVHPDAPIATEPQVAEDRRSARLDFSTPGPLSNLQWRAEQRRPPERGEIEIRVRATGLNFRDVMYAMGMLSDEALESGFAGATLGMECAGDVVAVGGDVTGFKVGDPVIGSARASFSTYVTTETTIVAHKPTGWTYDAAATIPSVFFTVYYAFHHLAELKRGEKVLIHGAAGGVGMAAIQYARYCGAEIFATAGSPQKRDFLRLLGVDHVLDSRRLAFGDEIMDITGGEGVDVVLNSLSGEAMLRSLAALKPFGRFLELGKRDFYENAKMGLRPFRNNITYFGIDADQLLAVRSALAGRLFREMMGLFEQGAFRPLVHQTFPAGRVADAFRLMQQSGHIGKIVIAYEDEQEMPVVAGRSAPAQSLELDPQASYLITGGLGGFGLATARWLADKGARNLVLVGRSGAATPEAQEGLDALHAAGANVEVCQADVTDRAALEAVFDKIDTELPPLKGVIHAAMVLDDALIQNQDEGSFCRAFEPKVLGAWHLHEFTRTRRLDFFVVYSSATTCFGNPGQSNYVAANTYLEALAEHRRSLGLPALAVSWGPISDVGYLARNEQVREMLGARIGGKALTSTQALAALERLLGADLGSVAVADLDWRTLSRALPAAHSPRFGRLGGQGRDDGAQGADDLRDLIAGLSDDEVQEAVTEVLREQVAKVLRLPADKLDVNASIYDLGMDSLMAVELHMAIEERFALHVPVMAVAEGVSVAQLATRLAGQLCGRSPVAESAAAPQSDAVARLVSRHGETVTPQEVDDFIEGMADAPRRQGSAP